MRNDDYFDNRINLAVNGDVDAQLEIGLHYCRGEDVELDYTKAFYWLNKASEQNSMAALGMLGLLHHRGLGTTQDYAKSIEIFTKLAEQGDAEGQYELGRCYLVGEGVERDPSKAIKWYMKAAEQDYLEAQHMVGLCYRDGEGVEKDEAKSIELITKVAERGHADAQYDLAQCFRLGEGGVEQNFQQAVKWLRKAARQNQAEAQYLLACCYKHGEGVKKDSKQAMKWLLLAANQGFSDAQHQLGLCHQAGEQVDQNDIKAAELFSKAAEQGNANAQFSLSMCYFHGDGVEKNMRQVMNLLDDIVNNSHNAGTDAYNQAKFVIESNKELHKTMREEIGLRRTEVFISYKRDEDDDILNELKVSLDVLKRSHDEITYWYDGMINTGQKWYDEIKQHLQKSKVAILLVSEAFLASDFIYYEELPELLQATENEDATIIWIPVSDSQVDSIKIKNEDKNIEVCIADYQAACNPKKPLRDMTLSERKKIYSSICQDIKKAYGIIT